MSYRSGMSGIVGEAYFPGSGATTLPPNYAAMPTRWVQEALKWESRHSDGRIRDPGTVDGVYGARTRASLNDFVSDVQPHASFQLWVMGTGSTSTLGLLDDFQRTLNESRARYLASQRTSTRTSAPPATTTPATTGREGSIIIGPHLDPVETTPESTPAPGWTTPVLVGGSVLLLLTAAYFVYRRRLPVVANGRRSRRRRR